MKSLLQSLCHVLLPSAVLWWYLHSSAPQKINHLDSAEVRQLQHHDESVQVEIDAIWKRIESHLQTRGWKEGVRLNPPATLEQIAAMEKELGYCLAADYKASLLVHNGSRGEFCSSHFLHSIDRIVEIWECDIGERSFWPPVRLHPDAEKVTSGDWHPGWVPVASWDVYTAVVNVETGGVFFWDGYDAKYDAASWKVWLETVASRLESGELYREQYAPSRWSWRTKADAAGIDYATPGSETRRW